MQMSKIGETSFAAACGCLWHGSESDRDIGGWERGAKRRRTFGDCLHRPYFISKMEEKGFIHSAIETEPLQAVAEEALSATAFLKLPLQQFGILLKARIHALGLSIRQSRPVRL